MRGQDRIDAKMELVLPEVRPGEAVQYRICNTGTVELICGLPYRLERQIEGAWVHMNAGMAFRLIGFPVFPGHCRELDARIPDDAPPGRYRLIAWVGSDHLTGRVEVSGQFLVGS